MRREPQAYHIQTLIRRVSRQNPIPVPISSTPIRSGLNHEFSHVFFLHFGLDFIARLLFLVKSSTIKIIFCKPIKFQISDLMISHSHGVPKPEGRRKVLTMPSETRLTPSEIRTSLGCCGVIVLLVIAIVGSLIIHRNNDYENYNLGHQAYQKFDCAEAIKYYEKALTTLTFFDGEIRSLAGSEKLECVAFMEGVAKQQAKDFTGALIAYNSFITTYTASPLVEVARNKAESIYSENEPDSFVNDELCKQIDEFLINDLIPHQDTNLPLVYFACGQLYEKTEFFVLANDYYELFLNGYSDHPLASEVESALLRSIVNGAKKYGSGKLPPPEQSGTTEDGSTVVIIRNESPESLRIVFSGSENRIEELEACSTCTTYYASPLFCPNLGPVGRYIINPGQYFVVVESTSDSGITPWSGDWTLESGGEYTNCFFIVKRSSW